MTIGWRAQDRQETNVAGGRAQEETTGSEASWGQEKVST